MVMGVDRCVCREVLFSRLILLARERGAGFDELQRLTGCGTGCGMCIPYIRVALATGRGDLPVMELPEEEDFTTEAQRHRERKQESRERREE
jgi:NAD(P)H-nitrite reductase large subunit